MRSFTQVPLIWTNSPALINTARPTTVTRSLWPLALTRSTQNPFSGLWNVTRSTRPARASLAVVWAIVATSFAPFPESASAALLTGGMMDRPTLVRDGGSSITLSQTTELTRVKARIKALAEKTVSNGCTEAEAMAAAEMVGRLLERYALSMEEIDVREAHCVRVEVPIGGRQRRPIDSCVPSIARFCDCKVWISRDDDVPSYVFFGFESDTALASYLYSLINHAMRTELEVFRAAHPQLRATRLRDASKSFQQGMAVRIADRLDHMHQTRDANVAAQRSTGTALMLIKHRVVEDAFRETEIRLVSAGSLTRARVNGAFRHGMAAGDRVNLNRPVQGVGNTLLP